MKINGTISVEDVNLHVDIQAPDDAKDLYVTNISSRCLVIPKERWFLRYLGLSSKALQELAQRGLTTLDHVIDPAWKVRSLAVSTDTQAELTDTVTHFLDKALIFPEYVPVRPEKVPFPIQEQNGSEDSPAEIETIPSPLLQERSIVEIGIAPKVARTLERRYGAKTAQDLLELKRVRIVMTPGLSEEDVLDIDRCLKGLGLWYKNDLALAREGGMP